MRRKPAVSARALGVHWVEHPSNAMRHHVDPRLLVRACFSPVSAAFQLELPDSQLGCHGRLSSRHGLDSGDSDQSLAAPGEYLPPALSHASMTNSRDNMDLKRLNTLGAQARAGQEDDTLTHHPL
ncbi:hypothetical protein MY1884_002154 [Beauveria asiatica]